ncbi:hypothetical protein [Sphingobacterium spiritivorum]|uniref:N-acetyltransferase domain-containing protein n=1 Tax=Sphingobacterium spiritivorum ATCC 33861 TaxID=525373 RepID=D7VNU7_SPHSI|nr:hypothetical protein [Sphingobacterium spiritivorum]EFK57594.1 hypothetical protein HMPREF0766_12667 [Sphingobacterium spiritivorum ATCC 33861]QQT36356.1 hypothetical protein I6J01_02700 [Sphingobacterium spiritivorum]WQD33102.1 hypothetical protein U0038_16400 [Sphingobacterium spiritivorum]SUJ18712.1 Uncharacterised protein [Sphingobacterium spiritivorum]
MKNYVYKEAKAFSTNEINIFKNILINANEVSEVTFDGLIEKNPKLLIVGNIKEPLGIAALKNPNKTYKEKVFRLSGTEKDSKEYRFELGWVVSLEKGNGNKIVELISNSENNIYSTVREKNQKMISLLKKYGFSQAGNSYKSERGDYQILLFVK